MFREEHRFVWDLAAEDIPVIPPLKINNETLFLFADIPFALYPKKGGRALDEFDKTGWQTIGRLLARIHRCGSLRPGAAGYGKSSRQLWTPETATRKHAAVLSAGHIPQEYQKSFSTTVDYFIRTAEPLFEKQILFAIHGDCHRGNLLHRPGEGIFIVDFDDMCVGPAVQDLWMLLPGTTEECEQELEWFLEGYETFRDFPRASLSLIPALRAMRLIHFAAWCALQSNDLDFAEHFPEWGTLRYWNQLIKNLQQICYPERG
jgi:Ser/Thr protein kinase RdoA (MazF antagonist)